VDDIFVSLNEEEVELREKNGRVRPNVMFLEREFPPENIT
jgi:hypothetical protein